MPVSWELITVGIALFAPVYGLLWRIQSRIGEFGARIDALQRRISQNESELKECNEGGDK